MWVGHLLFFGLPASLYPLTFFGVDALDFLFVANMNMITYIPIVLFVAVALMLYYSAAHVTEDAYISKSEPWIVAGVYTVLAVVTGFVQIFYNDDLNAWYYDREENENFSDDVELFV